MSHWWLQLIPLTIIGIGMITTGYGVLFAVGVVGVALLFGLGWMGVRLYEKVGSA